MSKAEIKSIRYKDGERGQADLGIASSCKKRKGQTLQNCDVTGAGENLYLFRVNNLIQLLFSGHHNDLKGAVFT